MTEDPYALAQVAMGHPYGQTRSTLLETVLRSAEGSPQHDELAFAVRLELVASYSLGGESEKLVVPFVRLLGDFDRDPRFAARQTRVLWSFKHVIEVMILDHRTSLAQVRAVLDDMQERWREAGQTPHAVLSRRWRLAEHLGDAEAAQEYYRQWTATARDELSDCPACDATWRVWHLVGTGLHPEAVTRAEQVFSQRATCHDQPHYVLTAVLPSLMALGLARRAETAQRVAYRRMKNRRSDLEQIARHVEFLTRTGNHASAVGLVERHLGWLQDPDTPWAELVFSSAAALALTRAGDHAAAIQVATPEGRQSVQEVARTLWDRSTTLAEKFDQRNLNDHQARRLESLRTARPW